MPHKTPSGLHCMLQNNLKIFLSHIKNTNSHRAIHSFFPFGININDRQTAACHEKKEEICHFQKVAEHTLRYDKNVQL